MLPPWLRRTVSALAVSAGALALGVVLASPAQADGDSLAGAVTSTVTEVADTATGGGRPQHENLPELEAAPEPEASDTVDAHEEPAADVAKSVAEVVEPAAETVEPLVEATADVVKPVTEVLKPSRELPKAAVGDVTGTVAVHAEPLTDTAAEDARAATQVLDPVVERVADATAPVAKMTTPVTRAVGASAEPVLEVVKPVTGPVLEVAAPLTGPVLEVAAPAVDPVGVVQTTSSSRMARESRTVQAPSSGGAVTSTGLGGDRSALGTPSVPANDDATPTSRTESTALTASTALTVPSDPTIPHGPGDQSLAVPASGGASSTTLQHPSNGSSGVLVDPAAALAVQKLLNGVPAGETTLASAEAADLRDRPG